MTVTIQGGSVCAGGEHRVVQTDKGAYTVSNSDIQAAAPDNFEETKNTVIAIIKHQYLTRRAAGRNHNQALADLVGFVVRL